MEAVSKDGMKCTLVKHTDTENLMGSLMAGSFFVAGCTVSRYAAHCTWYCKGRGFVQTVARHYSCHLQACNILGYPHCQLRKIT